MTNTTTIAVDLAKDVFQVAVFNRNGKPVVNKAINPKSVARFVMQYPEAAIYDPPTTCQGWGPLQTASRGFLP